MSGSKAKEINIHAELLLDQWQSFGGVPVLSDIRLAFGSQASKGFQMPREARQLTQVPFSRHLQGEKG